MKNTDNNLTIPYDSWESYVRLTAKVISLPLSEQSIPGVVSTLISTSTIARPLLEFEIPENIEMAPTFKS
jgi:uncharacterized Zn finger protein